MPTVSEIVSAYPIAQYLAANDLPTRGLYAGGVNIQLPQKIKNIGDSVKRIFDNDPTDDTLYLTANFLWTLCGIYGQQALSVEGNAGNISPVTPISSLPLPLDFTVSGSSIIPTGDSSITIVSFIGYNLDFFRGGIAQNTTNLGDGSSYYSWNRNTGEFICSPAASAGELFRLSPVG